MPKELEVPEPELTYFSADSPAFVFRNSQVYDDTELKIRYFASGVDA